MENSEYILLIIMALSFLEVVFPPVPGDTVLIIGSTVAATVGVHPLWSISSAILGTSLASLIMYQLGVKLGEKILTSPRFSWWLNTELFCKIEGWFQRYGYWTLLLSRFLPVARSGVAMAAGIVGFKRTKAISALLISICLSSTLLVGCGQLLSSFRQELYQLVRSKYLWLVFLPALLAFGAGCYFWIRIKPKSK